MPSSWWNFQKKIFNFGLFTMNATMWMRYLRKAYWSREKVVYANIYGDIKIVHPDWIQIEFFFCHCHHNNPCEAYVSLEQTTIFQSFFFFLAWVANIQKIPLCVIENKSLWLIRRIKWQNYNLFKPRRVLKYWSSI